MEYLEQKQFADPQDLADFVNESLSFWSTLITGCSGLPLAS